MRRALWRIVWRCLPIWHQHELLFWADEWQVPLAVLIANPNYEPGPLPTPVKPLPAESQGI